MRRQLSEIAAEVFGVPSESLNDEVSPDELPEWTSLAHMNLVLTLEREYGIVLSPDDAMDMLSFRLIRTVLADHGVSGI